MACWPPAFLLKALREWFCPVGLIKRGGINQNFTYCRLLNSLNLCLWLKGLFAIQEKWRRACFKM
jgi:hypothetical protein